MVGKRVEHRAISASQQVQIENGEGGGLPIILSARLRRGFEQKIRHDHGGLFMGRVVWYCNKARISDGAPIEHDRARRFGQLTGRLRDGCFGGIERDHQVDVAIIQQLALCGTVVRKLFAAMPKQWTEIVVPIAYEWGSGCSSSITR